jgi:hypothetical protein
MRGRNMALKRDDERERKRMEWKERRMLPLDAMY